MKDMIGINKNNAMNMNNIELDALERYNLYVKEHFLQKKKRMTLSVFKYKCLRRIRKIIYGKKRIEGLRNPHPSINLPEEKRLKALTYDGEKKIVVFTCITGNYEDLKDPLYISPNTDYFVFSDIETNSSIWMYKSIPEKLNNYSSADKNRYIKMHPYEFFMAYDYAVYVDGSIQIVSDITGLINLVSEENGVAVHRHVERDCIYKEAEICKIFRKGNYKKIEDTVSDYKSKGFPKDYGMVECSIIVYTIENAKAKNIIDEWWEEYMNKKCGRDQIIFPYVLWNHQMSIDDIATLGNNIYINSKICYIDH